MTPNQIKNLLDKVEDAAEKIAAALQEATEIDDTPVVEIREFENRVRGLIATVSNLGDRLRKRSEKLTETVGELENQASTLDDAADQVDGLGSTLEAIADELALFEDA